MTTVMALSSWWADWITEVDTEESHTLSPVYRPHNGIRQWWSHILYPIIPIKRVTQFSIVTIVHLMFSTIKLPALTLNIWGIKRSRKLGVSLTFLGIHTNLLSAVCIVGISLIDRNWNPMFCVLSWLFLDSLSFGKLILLCLFFPMWLKWYRNVKMKGRFKRSLLRYH